MFDLCWNTCRGCADVRALLRDDQVYEAAAAEAFPEYNKAHLVSLELPDRSGDVSTPLSSDLRFVVRFPFQHRSLFENRSHTWDENTVPSN
jgi:hypothetical protein